MSCFACEKRGESQSGTQESIIFVRKYNIKMMRMKISKIIPILLPAVLCLFPSCEYDDMVAAEYYKVDKITSIQSLFDNMARQPEAADDLINAAERIAGYSDISELTPVGIYISKDFGYARGACIAACAQAAARQPEIYDLLLDTAVKFLGAYNSPGITAQRNSYSKVKALPGILEGIARQPEIYNKYKELCNTLLGVDLSDEI